jgi:hypothetical protein
MFVHPRPLARKNKFPIYSSHCASSSIVPPLLRVGAGGPWACDRYSQFVFALGSFVPPGFVVFILCKLKLQVQAVR